MGVKSVSVTHADILEISCHSLTRVLLPAPESMESKRYTSYRSYSTNVYVQITEVQLLNYYERRHNSNYTLSRDAVNDIYNYNLQVTH